MLNFSMCSSALSRQLVLYHMRCCIDRGPELQPRCIRLCTSPEILVCTSSAESIVPHASTPSQCLLADEAIQQAMLAAGEVDFGSAVFANLQPAGVSLLRRMLDFNPEQRPTAVEALADPYILGQAGLSTLPLVGLPASAKQVRGSLCSTCCTYVYRLLTVFLR